jgi:signal peptide peptidase SppA
MIGRSMLATRIFNVPLLAERGYCEVFVSAIADRLDIEPLRGEEALLAAYRPSRVAAFYPQHAGIAVVPVVGALVHRSGPNASASGLQGYSGTQNALLEIANDPDVRGILLDLDTPGGEVGGLGELGAAIREISSSKPVWALANSLAASAGYWLAASADRVLATPYSRVGSIGVVTMHMDASKMAARKGIAVTFIHAGKHKVDGHQFAPLPDEVRERVQGMIDETYGQFVTHVAERRNMSEDDVRNTEARIYTAREALDLGLVDGISTLSETLTEFQKTIESKARHVNLHQGVRMTQTAKTEAPALTQDDVAKAAATARATERARIQAITGHDSAKGREALASHLAYGTDMEPAAAVAILEAAPKAEAPKAVDPVVVEKAGNAAADAIINKLRSDSPAVKAGEPSAGDEKAARQNELRANLAHMKPTKAA